MVAYEIRFTSRAERDFLHLPRQIQVRFVPALRQLAEDPFRARVGVDVKKLGGGEGERRLRVGGYRLLYRVVEDVVEVFEVGPRGNFY